MANVSAGGGDAEGRDKDKLLKIHHHHHHHHAARNAEKELSKKLLFSIGSTVKDRWKIEALLAEGGFGQIYKAADIHDGYRPVAIKAESLEATLPLLRMEVSVMKHLNEFNRTVPSPHFLRFHACGGNTQANFIVMDLCGKSMMELKKSTPDDRLSPGTSLRLACQMVTSLQHLHESGWLHRDVKPSNFCLGREHSTRKTVFLIDFGLCRNYLDSRGVIRPPRFRCGFRGTLRYASINIHQAKDMGRQDDLWSVFYILLEQICGQIPWRRVNDKPKVLEMKVNTEYRKLLNKCPPSLATMKEHLETLDYFGAPDYETLARNFRQDLHNLQIRDKDPYDWETPTQASELSLKIPGTPCPSLIEDRSND